MNETNRSHPLRESFLECQDMAEKKDDLQNRFKSFFNLRGYKEEEPVSLLSRDVDPTVIFIGSSTNIFKKYLKDGEVVPDNGVSLWQNKLRSQNYDLFLKDENPEYCSYFTGGGILMPPGTYNRTCEIVIDFLISELGISNEDLMVSLSSQDSDMVDYWRDKTENRIAMRIDEKDISGYRWKFGEDGMSGRGLSFLVKSTNSEKFGEFSTLEIIERDGQEIGVEWGFGLETFLCKRLGLKHPIAASTISEVFAEAAEPRNIKLADAIVASLAILNEGVSINPNESGSPSTVLRRFLQEIVYYGRENEISDFQIRKWVNYLCQRKFSSTPNIENILMAFLDRARKRESRFMAAITDAIRGNFREIIKLSGAREMILAKKKVNMFQLADAYAFVGFAESLFFVQISPYLDEEGNLLVEQ